MRRSLLLAAALAVTCGGPDHSHDLASVDVHPSGSGAPVISAIGGTLQLVADLKDAAGRSLTGLSISWSSSNAGVATVDANGLVTAVANGTATIVATVGPKHGSLDVTVAQAVSTVQVTPATDTVPPNSTVAYSATALDAHGDPVAGVPAATWASDNPKVTLDASGNATVGAFTTVTVVTITATIGGVAGHATLTVDPSSTPVACIVVTPGGVTLTSIGEPAQLSAQAYATCPNRNPIAKTFSWSSSDPGSVSVDPVSGLVTAHSNTPSPVTITASAGGKSGTSTISVSQAVASVAVGPGSSATLTSLGATVQLSAVAHDARSNVISGAQLTWSSSDSMVATIDATGLVTAKRNGPTNIVAIAANGVASPTFAVTVAQAANSISPTGPTITVDRLGATGVQLIALDANRNQIPNASVTWSPASSAGATVDSNGNITANTNNTTTTITASAGGSSATVSISVQQVVSTIIVNPSTVTICKSMTQQFNATARDPNGNAIGGVTFGWTSGSTSIVTIDPSSGLATGIAAGGPVMITASAAGKNGSSQLSVTAGTAHTIAWHLPTVQNLTIAVCDSIQWQSTDGLTHSSTSCTVGSMGCTSTSAYSWNTGLFSTTSTAITFSKTGTFPYCCSPHGCSQMSGTITVQ